MNCSKCKAPGICICPVEYPSDPYGIRALGREFLADSRIRTYNQYADDLGEIADLRTSLLLAILRIERWDATGLPFALIRYPDFSRNQDVPIFPEENIACWQTGEVIGRIPNYRGGFSGGGLFESLFGFPLC